ncbi:flagellar motor protein MotS [Virgibacillus ndiopensis]|uniref:flagellar motor protein MotS n=1 Tax=Virgibacillus ndiopensis TaxID=2004408 RepID=UPI000C06B8CF|nr:flagellar motor protein MotS [Virgibacillus ndiopensis]
MKRRPIKRKRDKGAPKWMVTYSDMVTLILVFFILLFSMSQIDLVKFEAISESFRNRMIFDFNPSPVPMDNPTENTSDQESRKNSNEFESTKQLSDRDDNAGEEDSLNKLMNDVEIYLDKNKLNNVISASRNERGVVLVLQELILFDPGEATILKKGEPFLNKIGSLLSKIPNRIKVEGHTDSKPMESFRYPSNWELSGARASSVVRYLVDKNGFDESRFTIVGYSDTKPLVPNDSPENMSKNRRVEIVILENDEEVS